MDNYDMSEHYYTGKREGRRDERDRIIKKLEGLAGRWIKEAKPSGLVCRCTGDLTDLIKQIRGEK